VINQSRRKRKREKDKIFKLKNKIIKMSGEVNSGENVFYFSIGENIFHD